MTKTVGTDEVVFLTPDELKRLEEKRAIQNGPDITVVGGGSIYLLRPNNPPAEKHLIENVDSEAQWWAGAVAVEHRYIFHLIHRLQQNGFSVA
jgi:hypothetical protein